MINGTLVKINRIVKTKPEVSILGREDMGSIDGLFAIIPKDTGWEFEKIKSTKFDSSLQALKIFEEKLKSPKIAKQRANIGLMLHARPSVEGNRSVELLHELEKGHLVKTTIANPLWSGIKGVHRNISARGFESDVTLAMQTQLFAMLESNGADSNWMMSFRIKDTQQNEMYKWQDLHFPPVNNMTPGQMMGLMKNVLNVVRLPWILLEFVDNADSCSFGITPDGGKSLSVENDGDTSSDGWGWLNSASKSKFERLGTVNESYRIKISDMRLTMAMSWAMNAPVLLHELSHYITFMLPTEYKINKGKVHLNYNTYSLIFAGHGALYMAVFSRVLIDFYYVKEESLYESIIEAKLDWFPIKSLKIKDINTGIENYCDKLNK